MSLKTRGILVLVIGTMLGVSLSIGGALLGGRDAVPDKDLSWEQARLFAERAPTGRFAREHAQRQVELRMRADRADGVQRRARHQSCRVRSLEPGRSSS